MSHTRLRRTAGLIATSLALSAIAQVGRAQTLLVVDGQPRAVIVVSDAPAADETLAAEELREHVLKMSGATLPVVTDAQEVEGVKILIGAAVPDTELALAGIDSDDPAAFRLRVAPHAIHITGLSPQGTLFATYELLEQLGVRWFTPGEIGTVIPATRTVRVRHQDTIQTPAFVGRILQHVVDTQMDPPQRDSAQRWQRRMRTGGPGWGRHGLGITIDAETKPELFLHVNGRPVYVKVSHPEVLRRVVARCRAELKQSPKIRYLSMGPTDAGHFGHSPWDADDPDPLHGEASVTDRYVKFFNLVLADVQRDYPKVGIKKAKEPLHFRGSFALIVFFEFKRSV